jgi:UDP-glucose 4-epimerase
MKKVIVTGAYGFLGRNTALKFKQNNFKVYACGHGKWQNNEQEQWGIDSWIEGDVSLELLHKFNLQPDIIVHCAGSGSVRLSLEDPAADFHKTVSSTLNVLDFIRISSPGTKLIYPSSAAVYGEHINAKISTHESLNPASPYGVHKKIVEELCSSYHYHFGINVAIVRFFSIYGPGLKKQLLWDASNKFINQIGDAEFWGTGNETRDWLYISDASELLYVNAVSPSHFSIMNGGSGVKYTLKTILSMLKSELYINKNVVSFNNVVRVGDPRFYHADITEAMQLDWFAKIDLEEGLKKYVKWFKSVTND